MSSSFFWLLNFRPDAVFSNDCNPPKGYLAGSAGAFNCGRFGFEGGYWGSVFKSASCNSLGKWKFFPAHVIFIGFFRLASWLSGCSLKEPGPPAS